jgi:hypothetical protein
MITFYIDKTTYKCTYNDKEYSSKAISSLARMIMKDGCVEQDWIALDKETSNRRLFGRSIKFLSNHILTNNLKWIKYKPMSKEAVIQLREKRAARNRPISKST